MRNTIDQAEIHNRKQVPATRGASDEDLIAVRAIVRAGAGVAFIVCILLLPHCTERRIDTVPAAAASLTPEATSIAPQAASTAPEIPNVPTRFPTPDDPFVLQVDNY